MTFALFFLKLRDSNALVAQFVAEHTADNGEVAGSTPAGRSMKKPKNQPMLTEGRLPNEVDLERAAFEIAGRIMQRFIEANKEAELGRFLREITVSEDGIIKLIPARELFEKVM